MPFQTVSNRKLYVQIADQITDLIGRGEFKPGQQLPSERELAQKLGVSRPTVREAIIALEIAGLIEVRVGVGAFVRERREMSKLPASDHSPLEIMQARMVVEPEVAALAALNMTGQGFVALKSVLSDMKEETGRGRWSQESDRKLHLNLAEHCGNQPLNEIVHRLWDEREEELSGRFHQHMGSLAVVLKTILRQHTKLVEAVCNRDPALARMSMHEHLSYVHGQMSEAWE
ncbi:transcriptional regulator, GntR family [Faunimonas pinastri]|uniref:Transcriptional regulator, GntR family n=1 Tax=Faunimonas pinastri TaxID=1855383 RepID=A0A1H9QTN8_9HYPH|nr:FadR/GntR family transcriptional regulator [Faunimonas pinastri]SER63605.1 transcriptional regulator, GntR family [Faunimonas pinastri]